MYDMVGISDFAAPSFVIWCDSAAWLSRRARNHVQSVCLLPPCSKKIDTLLSCLL